jgi:hypothetical protein
MSVQATDNRGGPYLSSFGGSTGYGDYEELPLRFRPQLDPLAQNLQLTFAVTTEQIAVNLELAAVTRPETG